MTNKTKRERVVRVWWLRKGGQGFSPRDLWMNGENAKSQARSFMLNNAKDEYTVIPCTIHFTPKKSK